ncbi:helix-turn-helix domain-containing protein [Limnofasciculus baicalensis]|uniref:Helix-turn-helix domain-containing protein n=1 Tax=Limnofasciculus baicalensis BBK-W-15 TaxID=2699891 RepID=A0AAE3KPV7_9CYAN|nr:helix-turn-helix transcriptional regulator [Limnofasciculus baicalensis]MCP2731221.1 helix-turn-helix domain-containing protein [Limnofasciculus baicalensis BBK-W-15]
MAIKTDLVTQQPEIGQLIREIRLTTGLTQQKFGDVLGFSYPTISRWENGLTTPSDLAIHKIELHLRRMGERGQSLLKKNIGSR